MFAPRLVAYGSSWPTAAVPARTSSGRLVPFNAAEIALVERPESTRSGRWCAGARMRAIDPEQAHALLCSLPQSCQSTANTCL
jgi:hypothetical protein